MRSTRLFVTCGAAALLSMMLTGRADADASHQILSQSPVKQRGRIVGFRATVLLDPQNLTSVHPGAGGDVRLGLGGLKYTAIPLGMTHYNQHRDAVAGVLPGYVNHQFKMREITGPNETDRGPLVETLHTGGQMKEVEVEVLYKDNPGIIPGRKADLVAGFWKGSYWHVWGAAKSPTHSSNDFVVDLPGKATTRTLQRAIAHLTAEEAKAKARIETVSASSAKDLVAATKIQDEAKAALNATPSPYNSSHAHGSPEYQALLAAYTKASNAHEGAKAVVEALKHALPAATGEVAVIAARRAELEQELAAMRAAKAASSAPAAQAAAPAQQAPSAAP